MKVRPAGSMMLLADTMARCVDIADGAALMEYLHEEFYFWNPTPENVTAKKWGYDARIGWDTYLVCIDGKAALFTDGPPDLPPSRE